jgi:hypothetical protein
MMNTVHGFFKETGKDVLILSRKQATKCNENYITKSAAATQY